MMATVPHVTSGLGLRKFQADGFLLTRVYVQHVIAPPHFCNAVKTSSNGSIIMADSSDLIAAQASTHYIFICGRNMQ